MKQHRVQNARSFPNELDCNQWCDIFHSSWNLQLYFFFFDVDNNVVLLDDNVFPLNLSIL
jgi:hypothetical protein